MVKVPGQLILQIILFFKYIVVAKEALSVMDYSPLRGDESNCM